MFLSSLLNHAPKNIVSSFLQICAFIAIDSNEGAEDFIE